MENNSTITLEQTEKINKITDQSLEKISQSTTHAIDKISNSTTEAINTLTPATNEAIANAVKIAVDKISVASIETVTKLSQAPTQDLGVNWTAIAAVATSAAVCVALGLPFYERYRTKKNCIKLIEEELRKNYKLLMLMKKNSDTPEQFEEPLTADFMNINIMPTLKPIMWEQYKFQLSSISPELYKKYNSINAMMKTYSHKPSDNFINPEWIKSAKNQLELINVIEKMKEKGDKMFRDTGISELYKAYQEFEYLTKDTK